MIIISLDIGTSKLCALALDYKTNKTLAIRSLPNDADIKNLPAGWYEQDPQQIYSQCLALIKELLKDITAEEVVGIGISGQMHGVLLVNEKLEPESNLITWQDQRTVNDIAELKLTAAISERTGCRLSSGFGGATLAWLHKNKKISGNMHALTIADFLVAKLTGIIATEPTHAASWGIFNVRDNCWDQELLRILDIPEFVLPKLLETAKPVGKTEVLGLSAQVCSPVGDNQASVIGAAGFAEDTAVVNLGTGGQISIPCAEYKYSRQLETRPMPFKGYIQVGASLCGGWSHAYLKNFFYQVIKEIAEVKLDSETIYKKINQLAANNSGGLIADTRFSGTRLNPELRGSISNINRENLTPSNLARAIIEGMVNELVEFGREADLSHIKKIVASGNAVRKNSVVREVLGKLFNLPCEMGEATEEAALGAARAAALGITK
jgi:sugar (pentulose or hexulose) kinase